MYGVGKRIPIKASDDIIEAIHNGSLNNVEYKTLKYFNFKVPTSCPKIPQQMLEPSSGWNSRIEYDETLAALAVEFANNYSSKYKGRMGEYSGAIESAMPTI